MQIRPGYPNPNKARPSINKQLKASTRAAISAAAIKGVNIGQKHKDPVIGQLEDIGNEVNKNVQNKGNGVEPEPLKEARTHVETILHDKVDPDAEGEEGDASGPL